MQISCDIMRSLYLAHEFALCKKRQTRPSTSQNSCDRWGARNTSLIDVIYRSAGHWNEVRAITNTILEVWEGYQLYVENAEAVRQRMIQRYSKEASCLRNFFLFFGKVLCKQGSFAT
jgi:hypothetical protein